MKTQFLLLLLASTSAYADKVAIFPPTTVNLSAVEADVIGTLLAESYGQVSGHEVISPRAMATQEGPQTATPAAAKALGAHEYLEVTAVGLSPPGTTTSSEPGILLYAVRRSADGAS